MLIFSLSKLCHFFPTFFLTYSQFLSVLARLNKFYQPYKPMHNNHPKKCKQVTSRFEYYAQAISEAQALPSTPQPQLIRKQMVFGQSRFHYFTAKRERVRHLQLINIDILSRTSQKAFSKTQLTKNRDSKGSKTPLPFILNEQIEIFITPTVKQQFISQNKSTISGSSAVNRNSRSLYSTLSPSDNIEKYCIYIVHVSRQPNPEWVYFAQRITLENMKNTMDQNTAEVVYQAIIGVQNQTGFFNSIIKTVFSQKNKDLISNHTLTFQPKVSLFESSLVKELKTIKIKNSNEQKISHPQFKRQDNLPIEQYKKFQQIKVQIYRFYAQLNKHRKINHYSIDNLICRFLKFKQYNYEQSLKSIKNYLSWEKKFREKYNLESFAEYKQWNLYEMIGKDKQGRILLLFRPYNVYPQKIVDENKYVDYTLYMLDIFIEDNTQGYIDDFILIADYGPFGSQNFKLSLARDVADRAKELFPDRQYKLVCFGLGSFSYFMYKLIKPFLPSYVMDKTAIFGTDKQELKQYLRQYVNIDDLPAEILGESQKGESYQKSIVTKYQKQ